MYREFWPSQISFFGNKHVSKNKEIAKHVTSSFYAIKSLGGWLAHLTEFQC